MRSNLMAALAATLILAVGACETPVDVESDPLDLVRSATERYHDVQVALAEGFVPLSGCVAGPDGGMGLHYGLPPRLEDAVVDPEAPEVLLYEPAADGGLLLVGVEFMVHQDAWSGAGHVDAPTFAGQSFGPPNPNHPDELVRPFHTLHVWVWKENPNGMFAPFNPAVSCD